MATYKVPQDVEAEDKLLGPFTFRQFIYLIAAAIAGVLAWGLSRIFIGLLIIPLPVVVFFLILALPLKKDQPMETYLTAVVRFWLKPRVRLWDPEGNVISVEITALETENEQLTKTFTGAEASQRLSYLSQVVDTGGWASRGLTSATDNLQLSDTLVAEARGAEDMLDETANVSQNLTNMIVKNDAANKQAMLASVQASIQASTQQSQQASTPAVPTTLVPQQAPVAALPQAAATTLPSAVSFNPYPSAIHQKVINPHAATRAPTRIVTAPVIEEKPQAPSPQAVSPDIIRLATNKDLSISTIAREAHRIQDKEEGEEVVISLR